MRISLFHESALLRQLSGPQSKICFILSAFSVVCLKELKIFVPEAVIMGNAATLSCQYDLDNVSCVLRLSDGDTEGFLYTGKLVLRQMVF